jgi:hypothetical protein
MARRTKGCSIVVIIKTTFGLGNYVVYFNLQTMTKATAVVRFLPNPNL